MKRSFKHHAIQQGLNYSKDVMKTHQEYIEI